MNAFYTLWLLASCSALPEAAGLDLSRGTIVAPPGTGALGEVERTAVAVLAEEVESRSGVRWPVQADRPRSGPAIVVTSLRGESGGGPALPAAIRQRAAALKPEGFVVAVDAGQGEGGGAVDVDVDVKEGRTGPVVWVVGADPRGVLFGVGKLLRTLTMTPGGVAIAATTDVASSPAYAIRGHQLGYRDRANSWDAWDERQYERYIRELAIFGANCVENIPFQGEPTGPLMKAPRAEMNARLSAICQRYGLDYWVWTPADFDLTDPAQRARALAEHEALYRACPRLDAVFVPGGDPGENEPEHLLPFLKELAGLLAKTHPGAKVWLSLQGFGPDKAETVYRYLDQEQPDWFGGMVCGPSSPSLAQTRKRLAARYPIRHYPDITHNVRAQFPVPWWDPALAGTLGREGINPRPVQFAAVHNALAPFTAGFLSYSDGVHDDVNKVVWTALAWDPATPVRSILLEYARFFFAPEIAETAADGLLALEQNWNGSLRDNGGVEATLALWDGLETRAPRLATNWRWQMCLVRAVYDAYIRARLIDESALEDEANAALAEAPTRGADAAMDRALAILRRRQAESVQPRLRRRIETLCDALFHSIGLQTSVPKHQASSPERGCILDFVDHPLNNRWWLEDQFAAVRTLATEPEKLARLERLRTWEHPGPGSFYDAVGHVGKSPHVVKGDLAPLSLLNASRPPLPTVLWWDAGRSRERPAWMAVINWPLAMRYTHLDPQADYVVRTTGHGVCLLSIDGQRVSPTLDDRGIGEFKEFPVPRACLADGELNLTFERPVETVNWRYQSRLTELWLLKTPPVVKPSR